MSALIDQLPVTEIAEPEDQDAVVAIVADAHESQTPIYPIGGGTSLDYGLPAKLEGIGVSLAKLNRVIDYPARDMTITVEAGVTMQTICETLAQENQRLPIDVPHADRATIGGVLATNFNGPRIYGNGTVRDYVIGVSAVDGRGQLFKGGGRVVKNVAGYDFCKLLTGSFGTLGIITQLTLKVKPVPEASAFVVCAIDNAEKTERVLASLVESKTTPAAIELLVGPHWHESDLFSNLTSGQTQDDWYLAVGVEGTKTEVDWMTETLRSELSSQQIDYCETISGSEVGKFWQQLAEFPQSTESPLVIKANVVPSGTSIFISAVLDIDPKCSIQAHAGNGIVIARFSEFPSDGLSRTLVSNLQSVAAAHHGNVTILSNSAGTEMTHRSVWGRSGSPQFLMNAVKQQFDPHNILNPGRFVYS